MKAPVNELLAYARLPFHFWTEVNGGVWPWDNPGCSIISLCAAKLNQHVIEVPAETLESLNECREFSLSIVTVMKVMLWLNTKAESLVREATKLEDSKSVFAELNATVNVLANVKSMFSSMFDGVAPPPQLDLEQVMAIAFLQAMIDLKGCLQVLEAAVIAASTPPPSVKA